MEKLEFKHRWESDSFGGGITDGVVEDCAIAWGITNNPRSMPKALMLYRVLKAAGTIDAESFRPQIQ